MKFYACHAYGFPGHPFPKFDDCHKTLTLARARAQQLHREGWRYVEILKELPRPAGHEFGAHWQKVDFVGVE